MNEINMLLFPRGIFVTIEVMAFITLMRKQMKSRSTVGCTDDWVLELVFSRIRFGFSSRIFLVSLT